LSIVKIFFTVPLKILKLIIVGVNKMSKVKGTKVRTRQKRTYKKAGSKRGRACKH
jgi:hypothetical protein